MKHRWAYSVDNGAVWEVFEPSNGSKLRVTRERDLEAGQIFFRDQVSQEIAFPTSVYEVIRPLADNPNERCEPILVRLQAYQDGWVEKWRGKFSAGGAKWDLGLCRFEAKCETVDRYTCLLEAEKVKRNILLAPTVEAQAFNAPSIEWAACVIKLVNIIGPVYESACSDGIVLDSSATTPDNWWNAFGYPINPPNETLQIYWREYLITECVGGSPTPPPGAGWVLLENNCATNGTAKYVREPLIPYTFAVEEGTCVDDVAVPPVSDCDGTWIELTPCGLVVDGTEYPPYFLCFDPTPIDLQGARTLQGALDYILSVSECGASVVVSDFFDWNAPGDAPGYVAGENYVTGEASQTAALIILDKSDAKNPTATNPATIGETTFSEMMDSLFAMFRVYWDIDDDGNVRIEHYSYWLLAADLDIRLLAQVNEPLRYAGLGESIPRIERGRWMEAQGRDFVGKDIVYDSACAKADDPKEWSAGRITTDFSFIANDPDAISNDGFVILATTIISGVYVGIVDDGAITGNSVSNAPLSWANLQRDYWTWDRYLPSAIMNGSQTDFDDYLPNQEQGDVTIPLCADTIDFDARAPVSTSLGERLLPDTNAVVRSAVFDFYNSRIELVLLYSY